MIPKWSQNDPKMILKWFQNDPKMIPKWSRNDPKMILKWSQNDSKMTLKWSQNSSKMIPKWFQNDPKMITKWSHNYPKMTRARARVRASKRLWELFLSDFVVCPVKTSTPVRKGWGIPAVLVPWGPPSVSTAFTRQGDLPGKNGDFPGKLGVPGNPVRSTR